MPAQKHCELFYPLVGDVLGYTIRHAPILYLCRTKGYSKQTQEFVGDDVRGLLDNLGFKSACSPWSLVC